MFIFLLDQSIVLWEVLDKCFDFGKENIDLLEESCEETKDGNKADGFKCFEVAVDVVD